MSALIRGLILVAAVCLTTACGVKTAYNNADWLVIRWINDRVSLDAVQTDQIRQAVDAHLAWHCSSELPRYAEFLKTVREDLARDRISPARIGNYSEQVVIFGERLLNQAAPSLYALLASLDDDQVAELMKSFEARDEALLEEASDYATEEATEARAERMAKAMRRFTGRLNQKQRSRLSEWAAGLNPTAELVLQQRQRWRTRFAEIMDARGNRPAFDAAMAELMQPGAFASDSYRTRRDENRDHTIIAIHDLHDMSTKEQRTELTERLREFADDLEDLSCS